MFYFLYYFLRICFQNRKKILRKKIYIYSIKEQFQRSKNKHLLNYYCTTKGSLAFLIEFRKMMTRGTK